MKYLFVIVNCERAGAQRVLLNLTDALKHKHDIEIVALRDTDNKYEYHVPVKVLLNLKNRNRFIRFFDYRKQLKKIIQQGKYDGVISFLPEPNFLCTSIQHSGFTIINVRNDPSVEYKGIFYILMRYFYPKANACIVQTDEIKNFFNPFINQIEVIPNAVSSIGETQYERKSIVLSVGRYVSQKNHRLLIHAFSRFIKYFPEYECHIVGEGRLKRDYEELIKSHNLEDKVKLIEPTEEIFKLMQESKLFVLSSDYEGYPNVLIEAMACGCACIATTVSSGSTTKIIDNGVNGILIPIQNENELLNAMIKCQEESFWKQLSQNAIKIRESHSQVSFIQSYEYILMKVGNNHVKS